jgi:large repetitive protein
LLSGCDRCRGFWPGLQVIDNTRQDGTIVLVDDEGNPLVYRTPSKNRAYQPTTAWLPVTVETVDAAADLTVAGTGTGTSFVATLLSFKEEDGTVTTWTPKSYTASSTAFTPTADVDWVPAAVQEPGQVGKTQYVAAADGSGRISRIIAAVPPNSATPPAVAVTCAASGTLVKGCRALDISYATATTAVTGTPGDYAGQVKNVTATLWNPDASGGAGAMIPTTVASYLYDTSGRLVKVSDPRTALGTDYGWDGSSTRLAWVKTSGLAAYRLSYDYIDPTLPKLSAVTRDNPAGSGTAVRLARYVYGVPLSGTGLPDLTSSAVDDWSQNSAPTTGHGYAVFGPDYTGAVSGTGVDWGAADLQYTDDLGYTVNTASYGAGAWQLTATDYDATGNTTRALDAGAINTVRAAITAGTALDPAQVDALSTQSVYNADITDSTGAVVTPAGALLTDTYGPARQAALADGTVARVRPHTHTDYDQNAPTTLNPATGEPWRLPTTITTGVADTGASPTVADIETSSTTVNSYTKLNAGDATEGDPWVLGTPTKVTTGGITSTTRYDTEGRPTQTRQPLSTSGTDAGTTKTSYYTAGTNTEDAACGNKVEWAGLACRTYPAATPSAGAGTAAGGAATLPDSKASKYTMWLATAESVETSGTTTRTTTNTFDTAGRPVTTKTVSTLTGGARPGTFTHYDPGTGLVDYTGNLNAAGTDADTTARTSTTYDGWGRALTATNDLGDLTTTTYVAPGTAGAGQVASVVEDPAAANQPNQATTYAYDGTDANGKSERRGLPTAMSITRAGAAGGTGTLNWAAAYDDDGQLVTQTMPGAITQQRSFDEAGEPQSLTYTGQVTPVTPTLDADGNPVADADGNPQYTPGTPQPNQPWLTWSLVNDTQGRVRTETTGPAPGFDGLPGVLNPADINAPALGQAVSYDRNYGYDTAGRLTSVTDRTADGHATDLNAAPCKVRSYGFDDNGRRTSLTTTTHGDGDCAGTTAVTTISTDSNHYDTADRPTTGANGAGLYSYDALGRQTTLPAADAPDPTKGDITLAYYDDDLPRAITQNGTTTTFTLDSAGRRLQASTSTGTQTSTLVRHYTDGADNPSWTVATDPLGQASTTRYAESIGGDLAASLTSDGAAELTLANLHGDVVTTVPITPTQTSTTPAAGCDGWSDYTEYGTPRNPAATTAVAGASGYGWLGTKQRSSSTETAGLTLMGDRLYNAATGRFTSLDPEPGGNATAYTYPNDPINMYDLDGHWGRWLRHHWRGVLAGAAFGACVVASAGACLAAGALVTASYYAADGHRYGYTSRRAIQNAGVNMLMNVGGFGRGAMIARNAARAAAGRSAAKWGRHYVMNRARWTVAHSRRWSGGARHLGRRRVHLRSVGRSFYRAGRDYGIGQVASWVSHRSYRY